MATYTLQEQPPLVEGAPTHWTIYLPSGKVLEDGLESHSAGLTWLFDNRKNLFKVRTLRLGQAAAQEKRS